MSEQFRAAIRGGDRDAALGAATAMLEARGSAALADAVVDLLIDESAWVREETLSLLRALPPSDRLVEHLAQHLANPQHPERRNAARSALATLMSPESSDPAASLPALTDRLAADPDPDVRILVANALGESRNPRAREALERALGDPESNVVAAAAEALGTLNDPRALEALVALAERRDFWTGNAAILALGELGDSRAMPTLEALTSDAWLAAGAARALGRLGDATALEPLRDMIQMPEDVRGAAIEAAAAIVLRTEADAPGWLREALREREDELIGRFVESDDAEAARLLGLAGTQRALVVLLEQLRNDPDGVAAVALAAAPDDVLLEAIRQRLGAANADALPSLLALLPALRTRDGVEQVASFLGHQRAEVHAAAAEALGRSDPEVVLPVLEELRRDPATRLGVALAYGRMGNLRCTPLLEMLRDPDARVRAAAAEGSARCGLATIGELREALAREGDPGAARALVRAIGNEGGEAAVGALLGVLDSEDPALRFEAVRALGCTGSPDAFRPLIDALADPDPGIRTVALSALGELGDRRAREPLTRHIDDPDRDRRRVAAAALERLYGAESSVLLEAALRDPDREVRLVAVNSLARMQLEGTRATLERVAEEDLDPLVRHAAASVAAGLQDPPVEAS